MLKPDLSAFEHFLSQMDLAQFAHTGYSANLMTAALHSFLDRDFLLSLNPDARLKESPTLAKLGFFTRLSTKLKAPPDILIGIALFLRANDSQIAFNAYGDADNRLFDPRHRAFSEITGSEDPETIWQEMKRHPDYDPACALIEKRILELDTPAIAPSNHTPRRRI